ncbi:hypothetical protein PM082_011648 [Marasmius tenuissimus]|nr:hypothetical protein PM082_011648 [Marasmius tenuissimus]
MYRNAVAPFLFKRLMSLVTGLLPISDHHHHVAPNPNLLYPIFPSQGESFHSFLYVGRDMSESDISPAQFQRDLDLNYYCNLVSFTLLYYEYIITFGAEVSRIWAHTSFNAPTVIFYLNRYVAVFGHIPIVLEYFWTAPGTPQKAEM